MQGGIHLFLLGATDHSSIILGYVSRCCGLGFCRCALSVDLAIRRCCRWFLPARIRPMFLGDIHICPSSVAKQACLDAGVRWRVIQVDVFLAQSV